MFTEIQKKAIRLLIEVSPNADYMQQLAADDEFALRQISDVGRDILKLKTEVKAHLELQKESIENSLIKVHNDIATLTEVLGGN
jgi:phage host-nuclease inhibitor protein Gam